MSRPADIGLLAGRSVLGVTLLLAGIGKLGEPTAVVSIGRYLAEVSGTIAAVARPLLPVLPGAEVIAGVLLLWGFATRANAGLAFSLLAGFLAMLIGAWMKGVPLRGCGCFGGNVVHTSYPLIVGRDVLLLSLTVLLARCGAGALSLDRLLRSAAHGRRRSWQTWALALPVASAVVMLIVVRGALQPPRAELSVANRITGRVVDAQGRAVVGCLLLDETDRILGRSGEGGSFDLRPGRPIRRLLARPSTTSGGGIAMAIDLPQILTIGKGATEYALTVRLSSSKSAR